jgi:hypothetical protein
MFKTKEANDLFRQGSVPGKGVTDCVSNLRLPHKTSAAQAFQGLSGSGPGHPRSVRNVHSRDWSFGIRSQETKKADLPLRGKNLCESEVRGTLN